MKTFVPKVPHIETVLTNVGPHHISKSKKTNKETVMLSWEILLIWDSTRQMSCNEQNLVMAIS